MSQFAPQYYSPPAPQSRAGLYIIGLVIAVILVLIAMNWAAISVAFSPSSTPDPSQKASDHVLSGKAGYAYVKPSDPEQSMAEASGVHPSAASGSSHVTPPYVTPTTPTILARPTATKDCGYTDLPRGWYDIQHQGVKNDYCRYVGDRPSGSASAPVGGWFTCHLAGSSNEYTPQSQVIDYNAPHDVYVGGQIGTCH